MPDSYDLSKIGPEAFENMVNFLALKTLGAGSTGFGPGADGGRDGYFEGEAPYPSEVDRWKGVWYIQSKFHKPHLTKDAQKWLIEQVTKEIKAFEADDSDRTWPNNWIIATNIDPSGKSETGSFDKIKALLKKNARTKKMNVAVWDGKKILDLLAMHPDVARRYGHFLSPGDVITALYEQITENRTSLKDLIRYFVVTQFGENKFTKLDQAGSASDTKPGVHDLFIDLPFQTEHNRHRYNLLAELSLTAAQCHRYSLRTQYPQNWQKWNKQLRRARVALIKGGPGQGKSTIGQYLCQIHRANLILGNSDLKVIDPVKATADDIRKAAERDHFWPISPRIPIQIELKDFAHWFSQRPSSQSTNVLAYLAETVAKKISSEVLPKTIKNALKSEKWIIVFDGLDEVPNDHKNAIAKEVIDFLNDTIVDIDGDILALCTSRPQGYSGQFDELDGPVIDLAQLDADTAMRCATPLLKFGRSNDDAEKAIQTLMVAIQSPNIKELMTTPLQSHIMAVVVRDGGRPPERRWQLFNRFYEVMKKRESMKDFQNPRIAKLLQEEDRLLKAVHMRLGFVLHARAETSDGAQTTLSKIEFRSMVRAVVTELDDTGIDETVADVMEATTERLVLVSTPENSEHVRFDIRQLQEFFAAEFLYSGVDTQELAARIEVIGGDAHWREVMHFLLSALIAKEQPQNVAMAVQVLRKLNEGDEDAGNNLYRRRMARGGLLASRLLAEGVLDQSKKDRQNISPLFDPLFSIFDLATLHSLGQLKLLHSRQWLLQFALDKISTTTAPEHIGALYLLGWLLPPNHPDLVKVVNSLLAAPIQLQETVISLWVASTDLFFHLGRHRDRSTDTLGLWVQHFAISILNSENCIKYEPATISKLMRLCFSREADFIAAFGDNSGQPDIAKAIFCCLSMKEPIRAVEKSAAMEEIDVGFLVCVPYSANWLNRKLPKELEGIQAKTHIKNVKGVFRLLLACAWFAEDHSLAAITELVKNLEAIGHAYFEIIPNQMQALIPIGNEFAQEAYCIDHLREAIAVGDDPICIDAFKKPIQPQFVPLRLKNTKATPDEWESLAKIMPRIALNVTFNGDQFIIFTPELIKAIEAMPSAAAGCILRWGRLQKHQPMLLEKLKAAVSLLTETKRNFENRGYLAPLPFVMDIVTDGPLLAILAPAFIAMPREFRFISGSGRLETKQNTSFLKLAKAYGLTIKNLREVAESPAQPISTRAGALALNWLLIGEALSSKKSSPKPDFNIEQQLYLATVNECNQEWLTLALVRGILINASESDTGAYALVTLLMERCNANNGPRDGLVALIENWRERSAAPVNSSGVLERWLNYSFQS